jgi:hypothetical protein
LDGCNTFARRCEHQPESTTSCTCPDPLCRAGLPSYPGPSLGVLGASSLGTERVRTIGHRGTVATRLAKRPSGLPSTLMAGGAHDALACATGSCDRTSGDASCGAASGVRSRINQWEHMAAGTCTSAAIVEALLSEAPDDFDGDMSHATAAATPEEAAAIFFWAAYHGTPRCSLGGGSSGAKADGTRQPRPARSSDRWRRSAGSSRASCGARCCGADDGARRLRCSRASCGARCCGAADGARRRRCSRASCGARCCGAADGARRRCRSRASIAGLRQRSAMLWSCGRRTTPLPLARLHRRSALLWSCGRRTTPLPLVRLRQRSAMLWSC